MAIVRRSELDGAVREGILSAQQADRLAAYLGGPAASGATPRFTFVHVLYYLGGMIAIGAMSIFMTLGWNTLGAWGGCVTAVLYALLALSLTHWFLEKARSPGGHHRDARGGDGAPRSSRRRLLSATGARTSPTATTITSSTGAGS
jgi:hypothetical protein